MNVDKREDLTEFLVNLLEYEQAWLDEIMDKNEKELKEEEEGTDAHDILDEEGITLSILWLDIKRILGIARRLQRTGG